MCIKILDKILNWSFNILLIHSTVIIRIICTQILLIHLLLTYSWSIYCKVFYRRLIRTFLDLRYAQFIGFRWIHVDIFFMFFFSGLYDYNFFIPSSFLSVSFYEKQLLHIGVQFFQSFSTSWEYRTNLANEFFDD